MLRGPRVLNGTRDDEAVREQRGFTLIELMVVLFIIGIVIAGAVLTLGATGTDRQMQQERDRLAALIAYARERGGILTLEYGIRFGQHGYRFVRYDDLGMRWIPEVDDDTLKLRKLPNGLSLTLVLEGRQIALDDKALQFDAKAAKSDVPSLSSYLNANGSSSANNPFGSSSNASPLGNSSSNGNSSLNNSSSGNPGNTPGTGLTDATSDNAPQILLFSNGDTNAFDLTLVRDGVNRTASLQSSDDGSVKVGDIVEPKS